MQQMDKKTEDEFVGSIAFAMIGASELKKWRPTWRETDKDDPRLHLARRIAAHLRLANWHIERGPPTPHHSTHPKQE